MSTLNDSTELNISNFDEHKTYMSANNSFNGHRLRNARSIYMHINQEEFTANVTRLKNTTPKGTKIYVGVHVGKGGLSYMPDFGSKKIIAFECDGIVGSIATLREAMPKGEKLGGVFFGLRGMLKTPEILAIRSIEDKMRATCLFNVNCCTWYQGHPHKMLNAFEHMSTNWFIPDIHKDLVNAKNNWMPKSLKDVHQPAHILRHHLKRRLAGQTALLLFPDHKARNLEHHVFIIKNKHRKRMMSLCFYIDKNKAIMTKQKKEGIKSFEKVISLGVGKSTANAYLGLKHVRTEQAKRDVYRNRRKNLNYSAIKDSFNDDFKDYLGRKGL